MRTLVATRYDMLEQERLVGDPMTNGTQCRTRLNTLRVEWRGGDRWVITDGSFVWDDADENWEYEPQPSERDDDFKARTRYKLATAIEIAERLEKAGVRR